MRPITEFIHYWSKSGYDQLHAMVIEALTKI